MILKIKKLHDQSKIPVYAHENDAGFDLFSVEEKIIKPLERVQIKTGIAMHIPEGYVGLVWDKSGLSHKGGLKVLGGVIDSGYRGEVMIGLINLSQADYTFNIGDKVAQMIIQKREYCEIEETIDLEDSARGDGGFGSTGK